MADDDTTTETSAVREALTIVEAVESLMDKPTHADAVTICRRLAEASKRLRPAHLSDVFEHLERLYPGDSPVERVIVDAEPSFHGMPGDPPGPTDDARARAEMAAEAATRVRG